MKTRWYIAVLLTLGAALALIFWNWRSGTIQKQSDKTILEPDWFAEKGLEWGLIESHDPGPFDRSYFMPQILGSGIALFDADKDGRLDLLELNNGGPKGKPNHLYLQKKQGKFELAPPGNGLDYSGYCMGVATGDLNRDGWTDLIISEFQGVKVFLNKGDGTFKPLTGKSALKNPGWATSCAIADLDKDGWPDLIVTNYVEYDPTWPCTAPSGKREYCPPHTFHGQVTRIWKNQGLKNSAEPMGIDFEDITAASGLGSKPGPGLGLAVADFNGDGWLDILVANDGKPNHLWIHQAKGGYLEEGLTRGIAYNTTGKAQAGMGIAFADFHRTGRFDVVMTHLAEETHTFWSQTSDGLFRDRTSGTGLMGAGRRATGFGIIAGDFDLDGQIDLFLANGRIAARESNNQENSTPLGSYLENNQAFRGKNGSVFEDISDQIKSFSGEPNIARGLAMGDVNGDGLPDLVVSRVGDRPLLLINQNRQKDGTQIILMENGSLVGGVIQEKTGPGAGRSHAVGMGGSYLSASEAALFVSKGPGDTKAQFEVKWQDGKVESFEVSLNGPKAILQKNKGVMVSSNASVVPNTANGGKKP